VEFKEYPGRDHLTILEKGCERLADDSLEWLDRTFGWRDVRSARPCA